MVDFATELTMISSNKIRTNANHRLKIKSTQLLKYGVEQKQAYSFWSIG